MELSDKQNEVIYFADDNGTMMLSVGTIRSGKTFSSIAAFFLYTQSLDTAMKHIIGGRKLRVLEQEVLPLMNSLADSFKKPHKYRRSEQTLVIGTQTYFVIAGNDETSMERVQGLTIHSSLIDEATLVPENFFSTIVSRLTFSDSKVWVTCNPSYPLHWLKTKWIDTGRVDRELQFKFDDNPSLSPEVIERNRALFTGAFHKRMIEGLWAAAEGLVYMNPCVGELDLDDYRVLKSIVSCDYGVASISALESCYALMHNETKKIIYYIADSVHIEGGTDMKNKTDDELVSYVVHLVAKHNSRSVIVDKSAASFITALKAFPHRSYNVRKSYSDVLPGIRTVDNLFEDERLIIHPDCTNLLEELYSYSWDEKQNDKPVKENDHHCDAMRYGVMELIGKKSANNIALPIGY